MRNNFHPNSRDPSLAKKIFKDGSTKYFFFKKCPNSKSNTTLLLQNLLLPLLSVNETRFPYTFRPIFMPHIAFWGYSSKNLNPFVAACEKSSPIHCVSLCILVHCFLPTANIMKSQVLRVAKKPFPTAHMWLEGYPNPHKMEQSWECTFLEVFTHMNRK